MWKKKMSDDSDDSGNDEKPSRDLASHNSPSGIDDGLDRLTTRSLRDFKSSSSSSSTSSNPLSRSYGESRMGYLSLEDGHDGNKNPLSQSMSDHRPIGPYCKVKKSYSMDSGESDLDVGRKNMPLAGSIKRKLRRKPTKRFDKVEETYGNKTEEYEEIRKRVLQERAVVNAIEALQERWRMIMFKYNDCIDLDEGRKEREHKRLTVKRQLELIFIISVFIISCIPISVLLVIVSR